jgi:hypothetical protein
MSFCVGRKGGVVKGTTGTGRERQASRSYDAESTLCSDSEGSQGQRPKSRGAIHIVVPNKPPPATQNLCDSPLFTSARRIFRRKIPPARNKRAPNGRRASRNASSARVHIVQLANGRAERKNLRLVDSMNHKIRIRFTRAPCNFSKFRP